MSKSTWLQLIEKFSSTNEKWPTPGDIFPSWADELGVFRSRLPALIKQCQTGEGSNNANRQVFLDKLAPAHENLGSGGNALMANFASFAIWSGVPSDPNRPGAHKPGDYKEMPDLDKLKMQATTPYVFIGFNFGDAVKEDAISEGARWHNFHGSGLPENSHWNIRSLARAVATTPAAQGSYMTDLFKNIPTAETSGITQLRSSQGGAALYHELVELHTSLLSHELEMVREVVGEDLVLIPLGGEAQSLIHTMFCNGQHTDGAHGSPTVAKAKTCPPAVGSQRRYKVIDMPHYAAVSRGTVPKDSYDEAFKLLAE